MANTIIHRMSKHTLIREFSKNITKKFWCINNQYIYADSNSWDNNVWVSNILDSNGNIVKELAHYRNKSYSNDGLVAMPNESSIKEIQAVRFEIMLEQGFVFSPTGIVGLHCIILDLDSQEILISQFLSENDFKITSDRLLIDGSFWMTKADIYLPKTSGLLCATITELYADDINNETGLIYNFNAPSEQLVDKKEMVETIKTSAEIDENFYLNISLYSLENKSVEQTLIDYIGHEPSNIEVNYDIKYGNESIGYKEFKISNEINKFSPIKIGLDFSDWNDTNNEIIDIQIITNINYENNPMTRETLLTINIKKVINPIINRLLEQHRPDTVYPVNVNIENKIEQTVVETNTDRQVVQVLQPIFCEMIKESFVIENKHIVFENFNQPGYIVIDKTKKIDEQILKTDVTVDGRYYFDLSKLIPVDSNTTYTIYDENQRMILGSGSVFKA